MMILVRCCSILWLFPWPFRSRFARGCQELFEGVSVYKPLASKLEAVKNMGSKQLGQIRHAQICTLGGFRCSYIFATEIYIALYLCHILSSLSVTSQTKYSIISSDVLFTSVSLDN